HPDPTNTPSDRTGLFNRAVQDAVETYFFPFLPHQLVEKVPMKGARLNSDGIKLAKAGDFEGAAAVFEKAIAANAEDAWAHYNLGISRWALGRAEEARSSLARA